MERINGLEQNATALASIAGEVTEINDSIHAPVRWLGIAAPQTATNWGEVEGLTPYRAISGLGVFGADANDEALVIGTDDTPFIAGRTHFDVHRILVSAASNANPFVLRIIYGTGTIGDAQTANQYTDFMLSDARKGLSVPIHMPEGASGVTKLWVRAKNAADNATVDFFIGAHTHSCDCEV